MTSAGRRRRCAATQRASPSAKIATAMMTMSMPSESCGIPNVARGWPVRKSIPTTPIARPRNSEIAPRIFDEPSTAVTATSANSMIARYDGAPRVTANREIGGANAANRIVPMVPTTRRQRARHVESRMRGDTHVRFGGRARETDPGQPGHRARARPNRSDTPRIMSDRDHRWSATRPEFWPPRGRSFSQVSALHGPPECRVVVVHTASSVSGARCRRMVSSDAA